MTTTLRGSDNFDSAAIAASKLTGTLPAIDGGALTGNVGKVVQIREFQTSTSTVTTSTTSVATDLLMSFTPKLTNSSLLVQFSFTGYSLSTSNGVEFDVWKNGTRMVMTGGGGGNAHSFLYNPLNTASRYESHKIQFLDNVSSNSAVEYRLYTQAHSAAASSGIQSDWGVQSIIIMELEND